MLHEVFKDILASRRPERHTSRLILSIYIHTYIHTCFKWKPGQGCDRKPHAKHRAQPEHRTGEDRGAAHP
jgi:hypothetical protein